MVETGEHLVFLVSQPRSGSTLLQRMLAVHPDIATTGEPWLLLPPLFVLKEEGWQAEFQARSATFAIKEFLHFLPEGEEAFFEGIRRMYGFLYQRARGDRRYFLDKTPRYYLILPEIRRSFPKARFLILLRNPLAVLHSIYQTSLVRENLISFYWVHSDLFRAVDLLLNGLTILGSHALVVHYEKMVRQPEQSLQRICQFLHIPYYPEMIDYGNNLLPRWTLGDQQVYRFKKPEASRVGLWQETLKDAQFWRLARDYLMLLGQDRLTRMGYSFDELHQILQERQPAKSRLLLTFPFGWLTERRPEERPRWQRAWILFLSHLQRYGLTRTLAAVWSRLVGRVEV